MNLISTTNYHNDVSNLFKKTKRLNRKTMSSNCNDNIVVTFDSEVLHRPCKNLPCNILEPLKAEGLHSS